MRGIILVLMSVLADEGLGDHGYYTTTGTWSTPNPQCIAPIACNVDLDKSWGKKCKDRHGKSYSKGSSIYADCTTCTCVKKTKKKVAWEVEDNGECCDIDGTYYRSDCRIRSVQYGPCTKGNEMCEWNYDKDKMDIVFHLSVSGCSVEDQCLPTGEDKYWPEKCAHVYCWWSSWDVPTLYYYSNHDNCHCCLYEDPNGNKELINDGGYTWDPSGHKICCCKGELNYCCPWSVDGPAGCESEISTTALFTFSSETASTASTAFTTASTATATDTTSYYYNYGYNDEIEETEETEETEEIDD